MATHTCHGTSTLLAAIDAAAARLGGGVAVEWVPTDRQLADPFSRVPLGATPPGCGAPGDLVALEFPPLDPEGRPPPPDVGVLGDGARMLNC